MKKIAKIQFNKNLLPFWLYLTLFQTSAALHYTILAPLGERILPIWVVGILIGTASLVQLILDIPAGLVLDRFGYLRMLRITTVAFLLAVFVLFFDLTITVYILTLFFGAIGWLFFGPGTDAYVLAVSTKDNAGRYIGYADTAKSLGTVISVMLLSIALALPLFGTAFLLALLFLLTLNVVFYVPKERVSVHEEQKISTHHYRVRRKFISHFFKTLKRFNPASTMLLIMNFASSIFYAVIWFVIPLSIAKGFESGWSEWGLAVFDGAVVILGSLIGRLVDSSEKKALTFVGLMIFASAGTLIGFTPGIWFIVLGFLAATGEEIAGVSLWAWLNSLDKDHAEDGFVAGVITFFSDLGWTVGPILAGLSYGIIGPELTIMGGGMLLILTFLAYTFLTFTGLSRGMLKFAKGHEPIPRKKHKH